MHMLFKKKHDVICIGSTSKDIFFPTDEGVVLETPEDLTAQRKVAFELGGKYRIAQLHEAVGGVAANVAWALVKLGVDAVPYTRIGGDETGRWILREFRRAKVMTDKIFVDKTVRSDLSAIIVLSQSGERTIFHNRDANDYLEMLPKRLTGAEWFFVSAQNGEWEEKLREIIRIAVQYDTKIAYNPGQHNLRENPTLTSEVVSVSEVLILNKDEALELVMKNSPDAGPEQLNDEKFLLSTLIGMGAKIIGMSDGSRGAWGTDGVGFWHCPIGVVTKIIDTTGAGDSFSAAFFAAISFYGKSVADALRWGIAESGSVVGEYGASAGLLDIAELERRVDTLSIDVI
jgi:sugar/nucleoside kinase (ribokinase family)